MSEKYVIEIARRMPSGDEETLRSHTAGTLMDAAVMVESLRDSYQDREGVVWDGEELDGTGHLNGLSGGTVYMITMVPS